MKLSRLIRAGVLGGALLVGAAFLAGCHKSSPGGVITPPDPFLPPVEGAWVGTWLGVYGPGIDGRVRVELVVDDSNFGDPEALLPPTAWNGAITLTGHPCATEVSLLGVNLGTSAIDAEIRGPEVADGRVVLALRQNALGVDELVGGFFAVSDCGDTGAWLQLERENP